MNYGLILKDLRTYEGLKQKEIAEILEINTKTYGLFENQFKIIPLRHLNTLANFYNVSIDYILGLTNKKKYENYKKNKKIDNILLGKNLKEFRTSNNITLVKLANFLNTSHSTLSAYENGKTCILTSFLYEICKKYKISADYLLGKTDSPKYLK